MVGSVMISISKLVNDLHSEDKVVRICAIKSLGLGIHAESAIFELSKLLDDLDEEIASLSLRARAFMGPNVRSLKPKIVECLKDPRPSLRQMSAFAIGSMGTAAVDTIPLLASMLKDENRGVQMNR